MMQLRNLIVTVSLVSICVRLYGSRLFLSRPPSVFSKTFSEFQQYIFQNRRHQLNIPKTALVPFAWQSSIAPTAAFHSKKVQRDTRYRDFPFWCSSFEEPTRSCLTVQAVVLIRLAPSYARVASRSSLLPI